MVNMTGLNKNYLPVKMALMQFESKTDKIVERKHRQPKYDKEVVFALKNI
jgi:hypothetical protein